VDPGRAETLRRLSSAVSLATAGEIYRALEFLQFAREVRIGKHDLRRKSRQRSLGTVPKTKGRCG